MPLSCDVCGGQLNMQPDGQSAVCAGCGVAYPVERLRQKLQEGGGTAAPSPSGDFEIVAGTLKAYRGSARDVVIPDNVVSIGESAFRGMKWLETVHFPAGLEEIGDFAFRGCEALKELAFPDSLKIIDKWAFCGCTSLTAVICPNNLKKIGCSAFQGCTSLKIVSLPGSLQQMDDLAFAHCQALELLDLNSGLKSIGKSAFQHCTSLKTVSLPDSLLEIGDSAFASCTALENVNLNDGLQSIAANAFIDCTSLKIIFLPDSLQYIGGAFFGCSQLTQVSISQAAFSRLFPHYFQFSDIGDSHNWGGRGVFWGTPWEAKITQRRGELAEADRRSRGVCQHCGRKFDGIIFKECHHCHKPKDY